ncbi:hypothetical protein GCM10011383_11020 [Hymenobacter cavernae]|uniref:Uncharacterized protein n=2 Tax=Hymenobacter cavernae TaxID=2044852 RepID=A0ABQ1TRX0_9BACT|nr:hypothetical protein GCM10011383_11020 [Hymenobacter cavernae]
MNVLLLLATSYWTYCSLFSLFVLVALHLETKALSRSSQEQPSQDSWQNYVSVSAEQDFSYSLEIVYATEAK